MSSLVYDPHAPKKATNLSINSDLLNQARKSGINLSNVLEQRLAQLLLREKRDAWLAANREAIEVYNRRIETKGAFSDGLRGF